MQLNLQRENRMFLQITSRCKSSSQEQRSGHDLRIWLSIEPLQQSHSWLTLCFFSPCPMMSSVGRYFSDTTCLLLSGATVTRAALKVWEWAPVTCRQGRYLFFLEETQYLLLLLCGSELHPELRGAKHLPSPDTQEAVCSGQECSGQLQGRHLYNMIKYHKCMELQGFEMAAVPQSLKTLTYEKSINVTDI